MDMEKKNESLDKRVPALHKIYANSIQRGDRTIDDVPERDREGVLKELARRGLDGYAQPLNKEK